MHDPRIGRFFVLDPLAPKYPHNSPYAFSENRVIDGVELEGLEVHLFQKGDQIIEVALGSVSADVIQAEAAKLKATYIGYYFGTNDSYRNPQHQSVSSRNDLVTRRDSNLPTIGQRDESFAAQRGREEWRETYAQQEFLKKYENTPFIDFCKIGQGLPIGAKVAAEALVIEWTFGKILFYCARGYSIISGTGTAGAEAGAAAREVITSGAKVDLMGGVVGREGFINFDLQAVGGIADDVANFGKYFQPGSVKEMVVNNPMAPFLEQVSPAMESGGTITIRGQFKNKNFAEIWDSEVIDGYTIVSRQRGLSAEGYTTTNGEPLQGTINEIILKKN